MPAYVVALVDVLDPEGYKEYMAGVPASLEPYQGRFIARSPCPEPLEGGPLPGRAIVLEFPDAEAARSWHKSQEYERLATIRRRHSKATAFILPGLN